MILTQSHSICIYTVEMKHFRSNEALSAARKSSLVLRKKTQTKYVPNSKRNHDKKIHHLFSRLEKISLRSVSKLSMCGPNSSYEH